MLFIGYPITRATAYKIFNQPPTINIDTYIRSKRLRLYDIESHSIYVLGLAVQTLIIHAPNYMNVDDTIISILNYKKKVSRRLQAANADLSAFDLEVIDRDPIHVENPPPMAMTFDTYGEQFSDSDDATPPPESPSSLDWLEHLRQADTPPSR